MAKWVLRIGFQFAAELPPLDIDGSCAWQRAVSPDRPQQLVMQIYSDGCGRDLVVAGSPQASALAAAMLGPVAAGPDRGGHASLAEAVARMDDAFGRTSAAMQRLRELRMRGVR